ncbi:MAG: type II toxin-antitoxin system RelE/ParE family toxin [Methylococcales bacterium]|nr:type II toxin-antitoxin system RelE/ParE family toxin [Methylococcales bacterium]
MKYDIKKSTSFNAWLEQLKDPVTRNKLLLRLNRVSEGNFGNHKLLAPNLFELKFTFGGGIRIYYTIRNNQLVFLLAGGNKATQTRDIEKAKAILKTLEEQS